MSTPNAGQQPETPRPGDARPGRAPGQAAGKPTVGAPGASAAQPAAPAPQKAGFLQSIKGPLWFSFVLALVGGAVATMTASGGSDNPLRFDLGLIAFGIFFIVSLVVVAMLQLAAKDNPEHLSQGSGVHRSSEELHRQSVARRKAEAQRKRDAAAQGGQSDSGDQPGSGDQSGAGEPQGS
ncbi:hypothetical protein [Citricoccus sp.]|uniref:hypothetical protein n=1 Tax=Citricoccus sp. TaxID=1978372 RepID=UPI0028BE0CEE|nr:hypothetical protein [Citricoccus sp.]